ncbi:MAG: hypothetical protein ACK53E_03695 [Pseudanabaena sp.]
MLETLFQVLHPQGLVLEIACETGHHSVYFAPYLQLCEIELKPSTGF